MKKATLFFLLSLYFITSPILLGDFIPDHVFITDTITKGHQYYDSDVKIENSDIVYVDPGQSFKIYIHRNLGSGSSSYKLRLPNGEWIDKGVHTGSWWYMGTFSQLGDYIAAVDDHPMVFTVANSVPGKFHRVRVIYTYQGVEQEKYFYNSTTFSFDEETEYHIRVYRQSGIGKSPFYFRFYKQGGGGSDKERESSDEYQSLGNFSDTGNVVAGVDIEGGGSYITLNAVAISQRPSINYFVIYNDNPTTTSRMVTLNNSCTNNPTHYIASESSTFSGATWKTYSTNPSFELSSGNGSKRVYFKVKNNFGECELYAYDDIQLMEQLQPLISSFSINNGASSTTSRTVALTNSCTNNPTHYIASENSNFSGASWKTYSSAPSFQLSSGNGTKRVYFKVKNADGESSSTSDTITLNETQKPSITTFSINNGASSTSSRTVTLNNTCTNSPTHYIASENSSFSGASWKSYSTAPSFQLSSGNGTKRVYLKVKNADGESSSTSDTITLNETQKPSITTFSINNGASSTSSQTVNLNNTCTNSPTHYIASENSNFSGASWKTYSTSPSFQLSSGNGTKRVFFKVKNAAGECDSVKSDEIYLNEEGLTITVISPEGGEEWTVGSLHTIIWDSGVSIGNVKIQYSINNGSSWTTIVSSTTNDGNHPWTIPNTPSTQCKVRVMETDGSPFDDSDSVFTITSESSKTLKVGNLTFNADTISKSGSVYNLSGNININEKLWFSGNVKYTASSSTKGTLLSYGYPYVRLSKGNQELFTASDIEYMVNGNSGTLTPENLNHLTDYALSLVGIPIGLTSDPITIETNGVLIGGQLEIGSGDLKLCAVDIEVLYKPNDRAYLQSAQLSGDFSSTIPGIETASVDLNYDGFNDELTGNAVLEFPFLGLSGIEASVVVQQGCFNGFEISVGLKQGIPLGATGLSINGFTLIVDNICYPPEFYIFFGGDLGITGIPSDIFTLDEMGLGYQQPFRLNINGGKVKLLGYPVASISGYIDASGDPNKTGAGIYGTVDFGGFYVAEIDVKLLVKLLKFNGSAFGKLQIPDFECDSIVCFIIKSIIESRIDLPYDLADQRMDIEIYKDKNSGTWNGSLKGMVRIWNSSLAVALEYFNRKLHFSIGRNYEDMVKIFRNGSYRTSSGSLEQSLYFPSDRKEVVFAAAGNSKQPQIYLETPNGQMITQNNINNFSGVHHIKSSKNFVTLFFLENLSAGKWTFGTSNLSSSDVSLKILSKRQIPVTSFSNVFQSGKTVKISATVNQPKNDTNVSFYFSTRSSSGTGSPITENLSASTGTVKTNWNVSHISTGTYYIFAKTSDSVNPPEITYYDSPIKVNNNTITPPTNLLGTRSGSTVYLSWKPSSSSSVIGYKALYTDEPEVSGYKYEKASNISNKVTITGLDIGKEYRFCVVAFDNTGNISAESNVYYTEEAGQSEIKLNRKALYFGTLQNHNTPPSQTIRISNNGTGNLKWKANESESWLQVSPGSGTGNGKMSININHRGLTVGTYTGIISISDTNATNSPQTVSVTLKIYNSNQISPPFGYFSTPTDGSTVRSSIPVTGWVLDDIGVENVKIYRGEAGNLVYIGDAVFVEDARPDVEQAYPGYPMNYKAGWGYMMLTNFLPNSGNGTFKLHAIATDTEGHKVTLGTKKINCNNANAVNPFGAIDTPTQGGTASGSSFINWGWALTPQPNYIPTDGSTIKVYVDGVNIGHPLYNIYRADIARLFMGYANSNGAVGYFYLNTTTYENGVHTIQWIVNDHAGNTNGIGSRYFIIQNEGNGSNQSITTADQPMDNKIISEAPVDFHNSVRVTKGFNKKIESHEIYPDENGYIDVEIREIERLEIDLGCPQWRGYHVIGERLRPLPIGSTLDTERGIFYWQPGAGFIGKYQLVFITREENGELTKRAIKITIAPKFNK